ncbi:MAG: hypothetical protein ABIQ65_08125, partial [Thermoanaerobaculia bacterium]
MTAIVASLLVCAAIGLSFQVTTTALRRRGARPEQLLLLSLAVTVVFENVVLLLFGAKTQVTSFLPMALGRSPSHYLGLARQDVT